VKRFRVRYDPAEGGWVAGAYELEHAVVAFGRTLEKAREAIAAALAESQRAYRGHIAIDDELALPARVCAAVDAARTAKDAALKANALSAERTLDAIVALDAEGLSLRDIAYLVGLSHGRVHQILQEQAKG
jgi:DNA-directed RNA polymerase specialized sigma24 family protein